MSGVTAAEQYLIDNNKEYFNIFGLAALYEAKMALNKADLTDEMVNVLSKVLQDTFIVIQKSFSAEEAESFPRPFNPPPLTFILWDAFVRIRDMLISLTKSFKWEAGGELVSDPDGNKNMCIGVYLLPNRQAFFPVCPYLVYQKLILSYQSDYGEVPAPATVWADPDGMYLLTEEMLPNLTSEKDAFGTFEGWYSDETFTIKLNPGDTGFSSGGEQYPITQTFYAKWNPTTKALVSELYLRGIADSVRRLTGTTINYTPAAMVTALRGLEVK